MTSLEPLVSVLIPLHERVREVQSAIRSILQQEEERLEIIVVDDGSEHDPTQILQAIDPRVRVYRQEQGGPARARNAGIAWARGEFIAFCDSDDVWLPGKLRMQLQMFSSDSTVGMIGGGAENRTADGELVKVFSPIVKHSVRKEILYRNLMATSSVIVRRNCLHAVDHWFRHDLQLAEDWELWIRLAARCKTVIIPEACIIYQASLSGAHNSLPLQYVVESYASLYAGLEQDSVLAPRLVKEKRRIAANLEFLTAYECYGRGLEGRARRHVLRGMMTAPGVAPLKSILSILLLPRRLRDSLRKRAAS